MNPPRMMSLTGHIGARVSALVDGQLSREDEERAWSHVLGCPGCRRLVQREGWIKNQLRLLAAPASGASSPGLSRALYDVDAWAAVDAIERRSTRRRVTAVAVGGGAVGAALLGLVTMTGSLSGGGAAPVRPAPATIGMQQQSSSPAGSPTGAETRIAGDLSQGWSRRSR